MAFGLLLLLTAVLFVRPAEIIPSLQLNFYLYLTLASLPMAGFPMFAQLTWDSLKKRPITLCIAGLWGMVLLSNLVRFNVSEALENAYDFGKAVLYYLFLVAVINSSKRLKQFLLWLSILITVVAGLATLQYHEFINLSSLNALTQQNFNEETGEFDSIERMRGTGIFSDPNDLSLIVNIVIVLIIYSLGDHRTGSLRFFWMVPLLLLVYALRLTQSRGGLLSLGGALLVLLSSRFGWKKGSLGAVIGLGALLVLFGGRQTNFDLASKNDTGQGRIQIWAEGLALLRGSPLFGIGADHFSDEVGYVAHNSFVHSFTELGFIGGSFFVGAFYYAIRSLWQLKSRSVWVTDPDMLTLLPYLAATLIIYVVGMFSLSRVYVIPTYLPLGITTAYLQLVDPVPQVSESQVNKWSMKELGFVGMATLTLLYTWTRFFARYE